MTSMDGSDSPMPDTPLPPAAATTPSPAPSPAASAAASHEATPASRDAAPGLSYGNIYTPHAGSMIIQVQRESGLQSRTIVLTPRQVRVLRFFTSRPGKAIAACALIMSVLVVAEAARVPTLTSRVSRMDHAAQRLDTLEHSLAELQKRYDQVRAMMGADAAAGAAGVSARLAPPTARDAATDSSAAAGATLDGTAPAGAAQPVARPLALRNARGRRMRRAPRVAGPADVTSPAADPAGASPVSPTPPPPDSGVTPSARPDEQ